MVRIFGIIILILAILLFPPAALALISNNAVPGDATYPIKRKMEDGILLVASLNPTTKAWFSVERSNRRFVEATALLGQGKMATETLDELVFQTNSAADQVVNISDGGQKDQLITQLSESIDKYDKGLAEASGGVVEEPLAPLVTPEPMVVTPVSTPIPAPQPTSQPTSPPPTVTPTPKPTVLPTARPTAPTGSEKSSDGARDRQKQELEEARKKLEEIKKKLEEEKRKEEERKRERGKQENRQGQIRIQQVDQEKDDQLNKSD